MRSFLILPVLAVAALVAAAPASSTTAPPAPGAAAVPDVVPGEVIVGFEDGTSRSDAAGVRDEAGVQRADALGPNAQQLDITDGESVSETVAELRDQPGVAYAAPNYTTQVAGFIPNDPGRSSGDRGDWQKLQWNFAGPAGVGAPDAWRTAKRRGAEGGSGVTVAVLDSGAAYLDRGRYERAPDLSGRRWVDGYDFIDGDRRAYDENYDGDRRPNHGMGHGTHVAGTIRQATDNKRAVTGLAYRARVMPVRVLDVNGFGDTASLIEGIRFAAKHGADVINVSLQVRSSAGGSANDPIADAVRYAHRRDAVIVGAAGNHRSGEPAGVTAPANLKHVIAVAATTENACQAEYSNTGDELDIAAPGGGDDAPPTLSELTRCNPSASGRPIFQQTFNCDADRRARCTSFGLPSDFTGTSMAAPHVSAAAALLIATERLGAHPEPEAVEQRLEATARNLGPQTRYGAGLLDAAAALR